MLRISPPTLLIVGGDPIHRALGALGGACDNGFTFLRVPTARPSPRIGGAHLFSDF